MTYYVFSDVVIHLFSDESLPLFRVRRSSVKKWKEVVFQKDKVTCKMSLNKTGYLTILSYVFWI